jgi:undecaprenyl-diphosphatase
MSINRQRLTPSEIVALGITLLLFSVFVLDPFFLERAKALSPHAREVLKAITDVGKSNWMLISTGTLAIVAIVLKGLEANRRDRAGYRMMAGAFGFVFVSVGGAGLIANLTKNILGRARPKLYEELGLFDFSLFSFSADHAAFPSGHATNIFALATALAILWPKGKVLFFTMAVWIAASRVLIEQHYFTDAVCGALLGTAFPYIVRDRFAARRWLFERTPGGGYRIRGKGTRRRLGWPDQLGEDRSQKRLFGNRGPDSPRLEGPDLGSHQA